MLDTYTTTYARHGCDYSARENVFQDETQGAPVLSHTLRIGSHPIELLLPEFNSCYRCRTYVEVEPSAATTDSVGVSE